MSLGRVSARNRYELTERTARVSVRWRFPIGQTCLEAVASTSQPPLHDAWITQQSYVSVLGCVASVATVITTEEQSQEWHGRSQHLFFFLVLWLRPHKLSCLFAWQNGDKAKNSKVSEHNATAFKPKRLKIKLHWATVLPHAKDETSETVILRPTRRQISDTGWHEVRICQKSQKFPSSRWQDYFFFHCLIGKSIREDAHQCWLNDCTSNTNQARRERESPQNKVFVMCLFFTIQQMIGAAERGARSSNQQHDLFICTDTGAEEFVLPGGAAGLWQPLKLDFRLLYHVKR